MLVLKISNNQKNKKRSLFKRKTKPRIIKTDSFICMNEVFTVVEADESSLGSEELKLLLKRYSGAVICQKSFEGSEQLSKYIFDTSLYYSRAYLSALTLYLKSNNEVDVCIWVDGFRFCREWLELANVCRSLAIIGVCNAELKSFCEYCRSELGLVLQLNDTTLLNASCVKINLNNIKQNKSYLELSHGGRSVQIYPNARYFAENVNTKKLEESGISREMACAAVQVIPFQKVYLEQE